MLRLFLLTLACICAAACSSFVFRCPTSGNVTISGHTYDNKNEMRFTLLFMPRDYTYQALPLCEGCSPQNFTFPYAYAAVAASSEEAYGVPVQGMNEKGLAMGCHTAAPQLGAKWPYDPQGPPLALPWTDLMPYLLGNFGTVAEVAAFLEPQRVQVPTDFPSQAMRRAVDASSVAAGEAEEGPLTIPIQISLYDATGEGGVIEFLGEKGFVVHRNVSVITNMPSYQEQLDNLERWRAAKVNTSAYVSSLLQEAVEWAFEAYPGGYGSASRFVRLSMLIENMCDPSGAPVWPAEPNWSAGFAGVEGYPGREALAQADGILRTVDIVKGAQAYFLDWTQVSSLRDLTHRILYWKTPLTARWQGLNVSFLAEEAAVPMVLPIFTGSGEAYSDATPLMTVLPVRPGLLTEAEYEMLQPFIEGNRSRG